MQSKSRYVQTLADELVTLHLLFAVGCYQCISVHDHILAPVLERLPWVNHCSFHTFTITCGFYCVWLNLLLLLSTIGLAYIVSSLVPYPRQVLELNLLT